MLGQTIGNFRVVSKLGRGGMGEIYVAEQLNVRTTVAIKVLRAEVSTDTQLVQRFFNEAVAVSRIKHAGITKIFDVGIHSDGRAYLIMELLDGETLASRIRRSGRLSMWQLADVGRQIASILDATHAAGITHRDLKPENIFIVADRELGERIKILDFGIAKLSGVNGMSSGSMGTPSYMAPEQWRDAGSVDWRCDAYALGCVAFEMACGRPPFIASSVGEACTMHLTVVPSRARSLVADVPEALDDLIATLLAKSSEDRPSSMREIGRSFQLLGEGQPRPLDDTLTPAADASRRRLADAGRAVTPTIPPPRRRRLSWLAGVAAAVIAGAASFALWSRPTAPAPIVKAVDVEPTVVATPIEAPVVAAPAVPMANPWVRVEPPPHAVVLGIDSNAAPADRRGFRPSRKILAPSTAFEIQAHEVTWSEIEPWLLRSGLEPPRHPNWAATSPVESYPVTGITWSTADAYCTSLGGSLPSEEQWEYAARGPDRRPNAWGTSQIDLEHTHAFGGRAARPGEVETSDQDHTPGEPIYDLTGNVQEWTADLWREDVPGRDESWVHDGNNTYRAIRGLPLGSSSPRMQLDGAAFREPLCATGPCVERTRDRLANVGFRCVRDDEPAASSSVVHAPVATRGPSKPSVTTGRALTAPTHDAATPAGGGAVPVDPYETAPPPGTDDRPDRLDREMIADGIARVRSTIDACGTGYRGATVAIVVTVKPDGYVNEVGVRQASDDWLGACVAQRVKLATFEPTKRGGTFSLPFSF